MRPTDGEWDKRHHRWLHIALARVSVQRKRTTTKDTAAAPLTMRDFHPPIRRGRLARSHPEDAREFSERSRLHLNYFGNRSGVEHESQRGRWSRRRSRGDGAGRHGKSSEEVSGHDSNLSRSQWFASKPGMHKSLSEAHGTSNRAIQHPTNPPLGTALAGCTFKTRVSRGVLWDGAKPEVSGCDSASEGASMERTRQAKREQGVPRLPSPDQHR
ncbi:MAG: hypothetical protein RSP_04770 [Rhodanobacter sp.]